MVITVITVRVMQMSIDQVIDVIAVGDWLVTTAWTVNVIGVMAAALVCRCAAAGIGLTHFDVVFHHRSVLGHVMQVSVV